METDRERAPASGPLLSLAIRERAAPGMRVGLLGGSFNPAHEGHRHVSLVAGRRLGLHAVWWLVSPQNPLKSSGDTADFQRRFAAAKALARHPRIVVSDLEARLGTRYTADTLRALKSRFPGVHFVWLMGADNLVQLPRWKHWQDIMSLVPVAVIDRPGYALSARLGKAAETFRQARVPETAARAFPHARPPAWIYLHAKLNPLSATAIRRKGGWP
ncbi:MAG: nicotinate-nucleotide adenylyltransferase [Alphaproteobacteria bacterium]